MAKKKIRCRDLLLGFKVGRLTITRAHTKGALKVEAKCSCGKVKEYYSSNITKGDTRSCGCLHKEATGKINRSHGKSKTREYIIWKGIKARCLNKKNPVYPRYGGRGIEVCSEWSSSFESFLADMGKAPNPRSTIDRIDNDQGYYKENCRWASYKTQRRNTSKNRRVRYLGKMRTLAEVSELTSIPRGTLYARLYVLKWPLNRALREVPFIGKNQSYRKVLEG